MIHASGYRREWPSGAAWLFILVLAAFCPPAAAAPRPGAPEVQAQARAAVELRRQVQQEVDRFAHSESQLQDQIEGLRRELKTTERRLAKTRAYLRDQQDKVAEIQRRLAEIEHIRAGLEPFLDDTRRRLATFVDHDLQFLSRERQQRLRSLAAVLDDYQAGLAAKARAVLDALGAEAGYGSGVAVREVERTIAGGVRRVSLLRLGRLALFALGLEGEKVWRWDGKSRAFLPLEGYGAELQKAAEMAQRHRVAALVEVPLGRLSSREKRP